MNKKLLKSIMALHNHTARDLAPLLGISYASLLDKMNERGTEFKQGEMRKIAQLYKLNGAQIEAIFFG